MITFAIHDLLPQGIGCYFHHLLDAPEKNDVVAVHLLQKPKQQTNIELDRDAFFERQQFGRSSGTFFTHIFKLPHNRLLPVYIT